MKANTSTKKSRADYKDKPKVDHRAVLTNRVIEALENGMAPWQRNFNGLPPLMPYSDVRKTGYQGFNFVSLMCAGYDDPRWVTYNDVTAAGLSVKDLKSTPIFLYKIQLVDDKNKIDPATGLPEKKEIPVLKSFNLFNCSQVEGYKPFERPEVDTADTLRAKETMESLVSAAGVNIEFGGSFASYDHDSDTIRMPFKHQFKSDMEYYSALLGQISLWTGGAERLNRNQGWDPAVMHARETFRAQMATSMLCAEYGLPYTPINENANTAAWIELLRADKGEIFKAAKAAREICEYVAQFAAVPAYLLEDIKDVNAKQTIVFNDQVADTYEVASQADIEREAANEDVVTPLPKVATLESQENDALGAPESVQAEPDQAIQKRHGRKF